jgi:DNA-binding beta-propeller fold protein YncE
MRKKVHLQQGNLWLIAFSVLAVAAWVCVAGNNGGNKNALTSSGPRLVSIQPLPEMSAEGPMCEWMPASASQQLIASLMSTSAGSSNSAASDPDIRNGIVDRPPLRVIKDPYPTYSAVAMDFNNNEIILQDENLFQIMAYDRTANTPPSATMTEPKRIIGGHETKVEFNCGLYVDPKNGDIYSVNNDTLDTLVIFNREAKGNVPPNRELKTPHRTYGIGVDEAKQELYLSVEDPPQIAVYHKYASGDEPPIRQIRGNHTQLADAHGLTLDTKDGWLFVANYGNYALYRETNGKIDSRGAYGAARVPGSGKYIPPSITVYPMDGDGDVAPLRVIQGPHTQLDWPAHIFADPDRGDLYVANDGGNSVLVFHTTDNGDVAPYRVITGPKTDIKNPTGVYVDPHDKELVVSNMGNHMATVYPLDAKGDVAPLRVIRAAPLGTPSLQIGNPGAVAYDSKREDILVPN